MEITTEKNESKSFNSTEQARVLPVIGNTAINPGYARREFQSLEPIVGAVFRHALEKQPEEAIDKATFSNLMENVVNEVSTDCKPDLRSVLSDTYFDTDDGSARRFCVESLLCLTHSSGSHKKNISSLSALGEYFSEVFIGEQEREILNTIGDGELHLLDQCMQDAFQIGVNPNENSSIPIKKYFQSSLITSFQTDIKSLSQNSANLLTHFDSIVRMYIFHYITEVVRHLSISIQGLPAKVETENLRGLFYILEGERSSSSRMAVTNGWISIRDVFTDVFTHINCLEVLNHIKVKGSGALDYTDIAKQENNEMLTAVKNVSIDFASTASKWRKGPYQRSEGLIEGVEKASTPSDAVAELWNWIDLEIKNTGRDRIWKNIGKWFEEFAYGTLLQQRGRIGYLAVLPVRYLHLLVFLAVSASGQERIRLKQFWSALLKRGILLDETTKSAIVDNLESIGALETRSDSGDARYVRSPF